VTILVQNPCRTWLCNRVTPAAFQHAFTTSVIYLAKMCLGIVFRYMVADFPLLMNHAFASVDTLKNMTFEYRASKIHSFHRRLYHSLEVWQWCGVSWWRIIGPIFFRESIWAYQEIIMNFISLLEADKANSALLIVCEFFQYHSIWWNLFPHDPQIWNH